MSSKQETFNHLNIVLSSIPDGFVELRSWKTVDGDRKPTGSYWLRKGAEQSDLQEAFTWAKERHIDGAEIFIGYNARSRRQGTKAAVTQISAAYVDLDVYKMDGDLITNREQAVEALKAAELPPNIIADSGHGIQAIWFIEPTDNKSAWSNLQASLQQRFVEFEADVAVITDEARVLRLTPFANLKGTTKKKTKILSYVPESSSLESIGAIYKAKVQVEPTLAKDVTNEIPDTVIAGARNDTLMSLAGSMRGRGMPMEAIAAALLVVNEQRCQPQLSDREVRAIAKSAMRYAPDDTTLQVDESLETMVEIFKPFGSFMSTAFITAEQIIHGLHRGEVGMIQALPNIGKTTLMFNVAICAAIGREFNPILPLTEPRRVMYLDFENRAATLQKDLMRMASTLDDYERELLDKNLVVVCDIQVGEFPLRLSEPVHMALVQKYCSLNRIDLVVIDTLAAAFNLVNENDNAEMNRTVLVPLQKLLKDSGAAGLLVHHVGKSTEGGGGKIYGSRGASVLPAYSRLVLDLSKDMNDESCVILNCTKIKGQRFDDTILRLDFDARWFIPTDEVVQTPQTTYGLIIDLVPKTEEVSVAWIMSRVPHNIAERTVKRRLDDGVKRGDLVKVRRGYYKRIDFSELVKGSVDVNKNPSNASPVPSDSSADPNPADTAPEPTGLPETVVAEGRPEASPEVGTIAQQAQEQKTIEIGDERIIVEEF